MSGAAEAGPASEIRPRTREAARRARQFRQESMRAAAKRYGISPPTVQTRRDRKTTADAATGPKEPRSTVLTPEEEAAEA